MQASAHWLLGSASAQAHAINGLFGFVLVVAAAIFGIVAGLVLFIAIRFRHRPGDSLPRQDFGNPRLEVVWTVVPGIVLIVMFALTLRTMRKVNPAPLDRGPDLEIVAHQWWWEIHYPRLGVVTANEVHIPTGRNLLLRVTSDDVIHDFWVPALGPKIDAIPGHPNDIWLSADRPGTYMGACAEYCGAEHAWMRIRVVAQASPAFQQWASRQLRTPAPPTSATAREGERIFMQRTCMNCHAIGGTPATGRIGPDLTHLSERATLAAGALDNTPANLTRWLADPQKIKPGCHMPDLQLSSREVASLTAYLDGLE